MPKYLSGRVRRTPQGSLTTDRYRYLGLEQTEPNLGDAANPLPNIPSGTKFQIVSLREYPGQRFWSPIQGCLLYTSPSPRDLSTSRMPSSA